MAVYGYIRVSTAKQDAENQRYAVLDFCNVKKLGSVEFLIETVSGTVYWSNRELGQLIDRLNKADVLVVTELSRLGRSMLEIMEILSVLTKKGVRVCAIKGAYELGDTLQSKVLAFAFSLAAEVERDLISGRTREALARRRAEGKTLGRPKGSLGHSKLYEKHDKIIEMLKYKVAVAAISRIVGCSRTALISYIKTRGLDGNTQPDTTKRGGD